MTLHNLDDHISWLLRHRQIPRARLTGNPSQPSTDSYEEQSIGIERAARFGTEDEQLSRQLGEEIPHNSAVNVIHEFKRPAVPATNSREPQLAKRIERVIAEENMPKLSAASKSVKPSLLSQYQLATPESTTGTSISAAYAARFHKDSTSRQKTPFGSKTKTSDENLAKSPSKTATSKLSSKKRSPLSPRQTPRVLHTKDERVEYLDLTGENELDSESLTSSSSDIFGPVQTVWSADAASRTEPYKRGKKRKSDQIAGTSRSCQQNDTERLGNDNRQRFPDPIDEFVDIDTLDALDEPPPPYTSRASPSRTIVKKTVQSAGEECGIEEEYSITKTISRTETRIRKSLKPSNADENGSSKQAIVSNIAPAGTCPEYPLEHTSPRRVDDLRKEYSPAKHLSLPHRSVSPAIGPSWTTKGSFNDRIIEDSEEEDCLHEMSRGQTPASQARPSSRLESPWKGKEKENEIQVSLSAQDRMTRDTDRNGMKIGSPTDTAGQESLIEHVLKPDASSEPVDHGSQKKQYFSPKEAPNEHGLSIPASIPNSGNKDLITIYLQNPSSLTRFGVGVEEKYQEVKGEIDALLDAGIIVPDDLKNRRKAISERKKSLAALSPLHEKHAILEFQKNKLKESIHEAFEADDDDLANEQQITLQGVTEQIRVVEKEIGQLLSICGIVEANFDTHIKVRNSQQSHNVNWSEAFKGPNLVPRPSASSNFGSTQVVYQTQAPTKSLHPAATSGQAATRDAMHLPVEIRGQSAVQTIHKHDKKSSSPVRRPLTALENNVQSVATRVWPEPSVFGNLSRVSPQRSRIDFDDDFPEDIPDDFYDEMLDGHAGTSVMAAANDEFGDFDAEMLEFVEKFDRHQSTEDLVKVPTRRDISGDTNTSSKAQKSNSAKNMSLPVNPGHADLMRHAWSEDVRKVLKENFHLRGFRSNQLEAINATLGGKDAFVLMPTGGGKSLCYQLPAVVQSGKTRGVTVVVSPLISLMQDQVEHLNHFGVPAFYINGEVDPQEKKRVMNYLREPDPEKQIKLLYVTPEMVKKSSALMSAFTDLYKRQRLARFVIDEAHCVSQWGHDFRPDYKAVGEVRNYFPKVPIIALTATATENVKLDVMHNLGINDCEVFSQSFNRPNLTYEVRPKQKSADVLASIVDTIKKHYRKQSGIVYTLSRANCEKMADDLCRNGIKAHHYHAGLEAEQKTKIQKAWQHGKVHVIVATIAFGMGIDKPDVRFVIHHTIPKSLEGYYQETGRAGRDGKISGCYLYYGYSDTRSLNSFIEKSDGSDEEKARQRKMLNRIVQYCENRTDCRRVELLGYFGERFRKEDCNHTCDNCNSSSVFETQDVSDVARAALNVVRNLHMDDITILDCAKLLLGEKLRKQTRVNADEVEGYGAASGMHRGEIERIIYRLISENALKEKNVVNRRGFANQYLELGPNSRDFTSGRRKLKLQVRVSPRGPKTKSKVAKRPIKSGTGVAAALDIDSHGQSTDVSSPVRSTSRPRKGRNLFIDDEAEIDGEEQDIGDEHVDQHGYVRDGFVASDDSDDGFEPINVSSERSKSGKSRRQLGPPITTDQRLMEVNLNDVHLDIIQHFVTDAKKLEEKIRNEKQWKRQIFTDLQFREMAINWTTTIEDMLDINGINGARVQQFGPRFLPLIEQYHDNYESMMRPIEQRDSDKNHRNVIDLVSDIDGEDDEDDEDDEMDQYNQPSQYFPPSASLLESNERYAHTPLEERAPPRRFPSPKPRPTSKPSSNGGRGGSSTKTYSANISTSRSQYSGSRARGASRRGGRRGSGGFPRSRSASGASYGVSKRKSSSKRPSNGPSSTVLNTFKMFARPDDRSGGGRGGSTAGSGPLGFRMMPTEN